MAVNEPYIIDAMAIDKSTNTLVMLIADPYTWSVQELDHLRAVQKKINTYVSYIEKKGYRSQYGNDKEFDSFFKAAAGAKELDVTPRFVTENEVKVEIPDEIPGRIITDDLWDEYTTRCINCGRCNFVCPTCTCYTMQDVFYSDNGRVGERRRVSASCMVDGYTDVAGGGQYRRKNGERMRFKVLHKISDFKKRFGYQMCVGCGRCDDICPEYISFSNIINKVNDAVKKEVNS